MNRENFGRYINSSVTSETVSAYLPAVLPPKPSIEMSTIYPLLDQANIALGRLDGISITVPDPALFLYMYVRKEAVLSSQIEGTQSTLTDLLMYENQTATTVPIDDVVEVSNYVSAIEHGLQRIAGGFPLCLRLIREMHAILLQNGRGAQLQVGEFRESQNWIGGTRPGNAKFVPPPFEYLPELLGNLEKFLHDEQVTLPTLIKAGLAHFQFETIHPFLDGNGRLGRLLITFILCVDGVLNQPLLYLSLYFKTNRNAYYDHLQHARETGDLEEWLQFFLQGVISTADQAVATVQKVVQQIDNDRATIEAQAKNTASTLATYNLLLKTPISDAKKIHERGDISMPTINTALQNLINLKIIEEITGQARNKIYKYSKYLDIMSDGLDV